MVNGGNIEPSELGKRTKRIRRSIIQAVYASGKGHLGGSLSIVEILAFIYFSGYFRLDETEKTGVDRDHFLLSKGHAAVALYATLVESGRIDRSELMRINTGHLLAEHPSPRVPGVEFVSGSLGHGLSLAAGIALAKKMDESDSRTVVLLGDGECYEGSIWEAAQFGAHHRLSNLIVFVDANGLITHGRTHDINSFGDMGARWSSAGWEVREVDGHDLVALGGSITGPRVISGSPLVVIASTVKGKGITGLEGRPESHHGSLSDEDYLAAITELGGEDD